MFVRSASLKEMCLTAIVNEIDYFIYSKTIPEKHLSFLFHVYAEEIFLIHKTLKSYINEDCMMWFLHPRVKTVTLRYFHSKRIIERLKEIGPGITSLDLHKSKITEKELNSVICCIPHVVHLDLSDTSCSDETLTFIGQFCSNLESLNVCLCTNVTDIGMNNLCGSRLLLKNLNILWSDVNTEGLIKILTEMPSLKCVEYLNLLECLYENNPSGFYKNEYNLAELVCDDNFSVQIVENFTETFPMLKKLYFNYPIYVETVSACVHFKDLEELRVKTSHKYYFDDKMPDVLTPILPISQNLKTLILSCVEMSALTLVECFRKLESLSLVNVSFTPFKKEEIKIAKTKLLKLVMSDIRMQVNDVNYEGVALLISLSKDVTELHLKFIVEFPTEILDVVLNSMKNLVLVNFSYIWVKMDFLNPFFEIPSMTTIIAENYYSKDTLSNKMFSKINSCTLSWRNTSDDENDSKNLDCKESTNYYYKSNSRFDSDIISDQCYSLNNSDDDDFY